MLFRSDEVIVLGYPTGIRALLARAGERFVKELGERPDVDFWAVARELAGAELIRQLATRGIVGQVTQEAVVYDAETTSGGSGGPVVNLAGEVVAVNMAVIPGFSGSNLGVPVSYARDLIERLDGLNWRSTWPTVDVVEAVDRLIEAKVQEALERLDLSVHD